MKDMDQAIDEAKAAVMPFESWEQLAGESGRAYTAFCAFRNLGPERTIRKAVEGQFRKADLSTEFPPAAKTPRDDLNAHITKRYRVWRNWCSQFRWRERAADYDRYTEKLKQREVRKTIEAQGEQHRAVTGKMLAVVEKKLDLMMLNPGDVTQGTVTEWVETAIREERDAGKFADTNCLGVLTSRNSMPKHQGELTFSPEFDGL
jgi:hypothetical protein